MALEQQQIETSKLMKRQIKYQSDIINVIGFVTWDNSGLRNTDNCTCNRDNTVL